MTIQEPFQPGLYFHVYNRGNNYENIFLEEQNYQYFLMLTQKYLIPICDIFAYCLLPNHFHFLLKIKSLDNLPLEYKTEKKKLYQPFSNLFNAYSKAINKKYHRRGSLFQKHLKRTKIEGDVHFKNVLLYIHTNPDHHGFKQSCAKYKHSSYNDYLHNNESLVNIEYALELFDDLDNFLYAHEEPKPNRS